MSISRQNLTIVIVTLKSEKVIHNCIKSINQDIPIIVVENSDDKKVKEALESKYKNVECLLSNFNLGMGSGCNIGIKYSKTDFVLILNADVTLESNSLNEIFKLKKDDSVIKSVFPLKELIATVSSTSKLLIFETKDIPKLKKSGGVILQKIKNGNLSDAQTLNKEESLIWSIGKQIREESKINFWLGKRAQTGKKIPKRFNKDLKFNYN